MKKRVIGIILSLLIFLPIVYAGVSSPLPSNIELLPSESVRFKYQVQALRTETRLLCVPALEEEPEFDVEFDTEDVVVEAGTRKNFYGTVTAPKDLAYGDYSTTFCVRCRPEDKEAGATVQINTCGLPIRLSVVETRTRDNLFVPEKPAEFPWVYFIVGAAIVVVLIIVITYIVVKKKKNAKKPKKKR